MTRLHCGGRDLDLSRPVVMGVLNVTPDSFSDGGQFNAIDKAVAHCQQMINEGATIIDIGGESTRPNAQTVATDDEVKRVVPVVRAIRQHCGNAIWLSIDTSSPEVMQAAFNEGADIWNDVRALKRTGAAELAAKLDIPVMLMHMRGEPETMQEGLIEYSDVVAEVYAFLHGRVAACEERGIAKNRIAIDPGFGFGKTIEHNSLLLQKLQAFSPLGCPVLFGCSRKSTLGVITGKPVDQRVFASVAGAVLACYHGAKMIRVHDVAATVDALAVLEAIMVAPSIESMDL